MAYFMHVSLIGNNVDTGVEGVQTPLLSALPASSFQLEFYVTGLSFRPEQEKTTINYAGGIQKVKTTTRMVCDLLPSKSETIYNYPAALTTAQAFYHVPSLNLNNYWLKFNDADGLYTLPPAGMVNTVGAYQTVWACNIAELEINPDFPAGSNILTGKLTALTEE